MRFPLLLMVAALGTATAAAQTPLRPDTAFFVTTIGKDTTAIEHWVRTGNTITGQWIQHQGGLFIHDYALVLREDGWPAQYVMALYTTKPRHTFLLSVTYGSDSSTRIMTRDSISRTERVAAQLGYPVGAVSLLGPALALERARRTHADSTTIVLDRAEVKGLSAPVPVKFFAGDSARIAGTALARVDRDGRLLGFRNGPRDTRRVSSFDVAALVAGFSAADSAARASRVAIDLSPAALRRFVGEYALNSDVVLQVTLNGDMLMLGAGPQPPTHLMALTPSTFFTETAVGTVFEFETDASGTVTAMALVQNGIRQRAAKKN